MNAGWYDDGSGRQRWWDGERWTDDFAPGQAPAPVSTPPGSLSVSKGPAPVLGFVGMGLAVAGTILACIPAVFGIGVVILLAGFVVSLIGLFRKGAAKWPSIVGMILAVVGGAIGTVVLIASLVANLPGPVDPTIPTDTPATSPQQPTDTPTSGTAEGRLSPEELGERVKELLHNGGVTEHDDTPNFYPCMGQFLYDSELSDETLRLVTSGQDPLEAEREAAGQAIYDGTLACEDAGAAAN